MSLRDSLGGIIHTYQKYDPAQFPSPTICCWTSCPRRSTT